MVAVRNLFSSLNSLAHSGLLASGWLRLSDNGAVAAPADADARGRSSEPEEGPWTEGGVEPPLDELLDDPVVHLLMRADRLEPEQVRRLLTSRRGRADP